MTQQEKTRAKGARYFGPQWGEGKRGLSPGGVVATMRGARICSVTGQLWWACDPANNALATQADADVAEWLGYEDAVEMLDATPADVRRRLTLADRV